MTKVVIGLDRTNDQFRWREVQRMMGEGPTAKMMSREGFAASSGGARGDGSRRKHGHGNDVRRRSRWWWW